MSAYLYLIKIRILTSITYRFEFIFSMLREFLFIVLNWIFWTAMYRESPSFSGVTLAQMFTFIILRAFLSNMYSRGVEENIRSRIRAGDVALDFMKPINVFSMYFAEDIGSIFVNLTQKFLPLLIFSSVFLFLPLPSSVLNFFLFLVSSILGFLIIWLISAIFGLIYFWVVDLGPLGSIKDYIVSFLSGSMIPIWFFPKEIQTVCAFLPFMYTYQSPIDIFIGKISILQALFTILVQVIWCCLFFAIFYVLSKKASKNVMVQGG